MIFCFSAIKWPHLLTFFTFPNLICLNYDFENILHRHVQRKLPWKQTHWPLSEFCLFYSGHHKVLFQQFPKNPITFPTDSILLHSSTSHTQMLQIILKSQLFYTFYKINILKKSSHSCLVDIQWKFTDFTLNVALLLFVLTSSVASVDGGNDRHGGGDDDGDIFWPVVVVLTDMVVAITIWKSSQWFCWSRR